MSFAPRLEAQPRIYMREHLLTRGVLRFAQSDLAMEGAA